MVARIGRVDGEERNVAQVRARLEPLMPGGIGVFQHIVRESIGDAMRMDCDEADRTRIVAVAKDFADAGAGEPIVLAGKGFGEDEIAVLRFSGIFRCNFKFDAEFLLDGDEPSALAFGPGAVQAEETLSPLADAADDARLVRIGFIFRLIDAGENAVADACGRFVGLAATASALRIRRDDDERRRVFA